MAYIPPWLMGQQYAALNGFDANGQPFQAPASALSGQFGFSPVASGADAGSLYAGTGTSSPLAQGIPQGAMAALMSNPQLLASLSGLAGLGSRGAQPMPMRPPEPPAAPGRQYMAQFLPAPFFTVQRNGQGRSR